MISKALPHINVLGTLKCSKPLALTTVRWSLLKDMIDEGAAVVLNDPKMKMVYKSLLQLPTCPLGSKENPSFVTLVAGWGLLRLNRSTTSPKVVIKNIKASPVDGHGLLQQPRLHQ